MNKGAFKKGALAAIPTGLGYLGIGMAYGVIAVAQGLPVFWVVLASFLVYAGAAQFALIGLLVSGEPLSSIALTVFLINLRNFLMALHTATFFPRVSVTKSLLIGGGLTDESYGLLLAESLQEDKISPDWMLGNNALSYLSWGLAALIGALLGGVIPNPQALGLDFALMAMFLGIFVAQFQGLTQTVAVPKVLLILLAVAVSFLILVVWLPKSLAVLLATLFGCMMGVWLDES